jgi:hypothetical protein
MNLADMMTLITFVGCPVAAGLAAASEKAGWFTLLFIAFGVALGFGCSYCVRTVSYLILVASCKQSKVWFSVPLFLAYMFVPMIAAFGSLALTGELSAWLAKHLL